MNTNDYYNINAQDFFDNTVDVSMQYQYDLFEKYLLPNNKILEIGSGSGRDANYFKNRDYQILATDISVELIRLAKINLDLDILNLNVLDLEFSNQFDAIWSCASLLHLNSDDLIIAFQKCFHALKPKGIMYASFKLGDFEGMRNGRFFNDMNELKINKYIKNLFNIKELVITSDVRKNRCEKWLNLILEKI